MENAIQIVVDAVSLGALYALLGDFERMTTAYLGS